MDKMPKTICWKIGDYLKWREISSLSRSNKRILNVYSSTEFWQDKIRKDYPFLWPLSFDGVNVADLYKGVYQDIKQGYPKELILVFVKNGSFIHQLPIFEMKDRIGCTDYIDFIQYDEMTAGIMRFIDIYRRPGLLFRLRSLHPENLSWPLKGTLSLFRRYSPPDHSHWSFGLGNSDFSIVHAYNKVHEHNSHPNLVCDQCPFNTQPNSCLANINIKLISDLISGQDPLYHCDFQTLSNTIK